jgi:hypothetical protein
MKHSMNLKKMDGTGQPPSIMNVPELEEYFLFLNSKRSLVATNHSYIKVVIPWIASKIQI